MSFDRRKFFLHRYDNFFGKGSGNKLISVQKELAKNSFIRVNLSKKSVDNVCSFLDKNRVKYSRTFLKNGLKIDKSFFNLSSSLLGLGGGIYIQDLASQVPVNLVDFERLKKLEREILILDMAASPGSKTSQICDMMEYMKIKYKIVALEPEKKRIARLMNNLQKQGFYNVDIFNVFGEEFIYPEKFDLILLDAPCSGNLIDDTSWLKKRDLKGIKGLADLQKKLLRNASKLLKKDGELIYSTCSLEREEDEENVRFAKTELGLIDVNRKLNFGFDVATDKDLNTIKLIPFKSRTQGFFVCVFRKK